MMKIVWIGILGLLIGWHSQSLYAEYFDQRVYLLMDHNYGILPLLKYRDFNIAFAYQSMNIQTNEPSQQLIVMLSWGAIKDFIFDFKIASPDLAKSNSVITDYRFSFLSRFQNDELAYMGVELVYKLGSIHIRPTLQQTIPAIVTYVVSVGGSLLVQSDFSIFSVFGNPLNAPSIDFNIGMFLSVFSFFTFNIDTRISISLDNPTPVWDIIPGFDLLTGTSFLKGLSGFLKLYVGFPFYFRPPDTHKGDGIIIKLSAKF